jgi:hypothetical protein
MKFPQKEARMTLRRIRSSSRAGLVVLATRAQELGATGLTAMSKGSPSWIPRFLALVSDRIESGLEVAVIESGSESPDR